MNAEGVSFRDVGFVYRNGNVGLESLTFDAVPGRILGMLGPNGAGKSTTINIVSTALKATRGDVRVAGLKAQEQTQAIRNLVSLCPQEYTLDPILTVSDNLRIAGLAKGMRGRQLREYVERALSQFGLMDKKDSITMQISGGQGRRLQLARALMFPARILIVDEPTLGIDPGGLKIARDLIIQAAHNGSVVILATNDMDQASELCDDILFIAKGRGLAMGTKGEFIKEYGGREIVRISSNDIVRVDELRRELSCEVERLSDTAASILTDNASETLAKLVNMNSARGTTLSSVEITRPTLKDAFLRLVNQQRGDLD